LKYVRHFDNIEPVICDIRDRRRVFRIFEEEKPDIVFHAAAHKHVPLMEKNPSEAIMNNVLAQKIFLMLLVNVMLSDLLTFLQIRL